MSSNGRALSLMIVQVLLLGAAIYVAVSETAFLGASPLGRAAIVSLAMWLYVFLSAPVAGMLFSLAFFAAAVAAFGLFERGRF